jgi:surfeit locus 1 family protein
VLPFYVDADATPNPGGLPAGGQTPIALPNNHLQYAITWYALAAALVVVFVVLVRRHRTPGDHA